MSIAADRPAGPAGAARTASTTGAERHPGTAPAPAAQAALEQALAVASGGSAGIGDLLEALRGARLWLPLPGDGTPPVTGPDLTLPTVTYLGSYFVPAYSSASVLREHAPSAVSLPGGEPPHAVVAAADLARLLPPAVGIALNAGSAASVPVYPQAVSWLAGDTGPAAGRDGITVAPLQARPDALLAAVAAGLLTVPAARSASAAWMSVASRGEGLLLAVTLREGAGEAERDQVTGAVERAVWEVSPQQAGFPVDVTFAAQDGGDWLDQQVAAVGTPFYRRREPGPPRSPRGGA